MSRTSNDPERLISSHEAGKLIQSNPSSINKWVNDGLIQAFRTPGGHRRIRVADLVSFMEKHKMPVPAALQMAPAPRRVLIIDDDAAVLRTMSRLFLKANEEVPFALTSLAVNNAVEGLVALGSFNPTHVLTDLDLGTEINGIDICEAAYKKVPTAKLLMATGSASLLKPAQKKRLEACKVQIFDKPIDSAALLAALNDATAATPPA